jgi:malate synthase
MTQRGLTLVAPREVAVADVLTPQALALIAEVTRSFAPRLHELLRARKARQDRLDAGQERFDFRPETRAIREADWKVGRIPDDLLDRRVEITGPVDRKMILNALSSGAQVFMADFEDANAPTWTNLIDGQRALALAVKGELTYVDDKTGKRYQMPEKPAVLLARPRGLHLPEHHLLVDGSVVPGAFFDACLYILHNATHLLAKGSGPYLYLPKLESHKEAALWNDVLDLVEARVGIPHGSVKVTVLIETLPAAFEMDEILFALKDHIVGLNCGRWDYIFSTIKRRRREPGFVLPDRASITMEQHFLRSYTQLLIKTCHRRGAFAMGGMAAFIPRKDDADANAQALEKVRADKRREVNDGHDGTWVAHPGLVQVAREIFDEKLRGKKNQLDVMRDDVKVTAEDLLRLPDGARTEKGLRLNARIGVRYLAAWLAGQGCVPIEHLMEDAATAEISRAQLWQWLHAGVDVEGKKLDEARVRRAIAEETADLTGPTAVAARELFLSLCLKKELEEFLTLPAYELLVHAEQRV